MEGQEMEIGSATVANFSIGAAPTTSHPNDVQFKVAYPEDWEGEKTMPEGSVHTVSKESAAHFESIGIGKIYDPTEISKAADVVDEVVETPVKPDKKAK